MEQITYDKQIEVTRKQYIALMISCRDVIAGRTKEGKYYIKVWWTKYIPEIQLQLKLNE